MDCGARREQGTLGNVVRDRWWVREEEEVVTDTTTCCDLKDPTIRSYYVHEGTRNKLLPSGATGSWKLWLLMLHLMTSLKLRLTIIFIID